MDIRRCGCASRMNDLLDLCPAGLNKVQIVLAVERTQRRFRQIANQVCVVLGGDPTPRCLGQFPQLRDAAVDHGCDGSRPRTATVKEISNTPVFPHFVQTLSDQSHLVQCHGAEDLFRTNFGERHSVELLRRRNRSARTAESFGSSITVQSTHESRVRMRHDGS